LDKKVGLDYLSWAKAWTLVKRAYPDANYKITEFPEYILTKTGWVATGRNVDYRQTAAGYEVEAVVTIEGQEYSSKLFVMDYRNKALSQATYFEINKTQQRALVKALAIAGLGLSVYAGEDLPEEKSNGQVSKPRPVRQSSTSTNQQNDWDSYKVNYNGQQVLMSLVVKHAMEGNQQAKTFADTLKGQDLEAFEKLSGGK
jgi:hypothetical protein